MEAQQEQKVQPKPQQAQPEQKPKAGVVFSSAVPAIVEDVIGRTGTRGGIIQVRAKVLEGPDKNKILRRNVKGPIREKDIIMLRETEIEARSLMQGKRGKR